MTAQARSGTKEVGEEHLHWHPTTTLVGIHLSKSSERCNYTPTETQFMSSFGLDPPISEDGPLLEEAEIDTCPFELYCTKPLLRTGLGSVASLTVVLLSSIAFCFGSCF